MEQAVEQAFSSPRAVLAESESGTKASAPRKRKPSSRTAAATRAVQGSSEAMPSRPAVSLGKPAATGDTEAAGVVDASQLIRRTVIGLSEAATRGFMTDETIDFLRRTCPGWDLHALHADFERWVAVSPERTPADWQRAFIGWVKRHHEKHGRNLRG